MFQGTEDSKGFINHEGQRTRDEASLRDEPNEGPFITVMIKHVCAERVGVVTYSLAMHFLVEV
jgi:hypothetical protein